MLTYFMVVNILFSYLREMDVVLFQVAAIIGGRHLFVVLLPCVAFNQYWRYLVCFSRATVGVDRIRSLWGSAGLSEKEPWIK